MLPEVDFFFNFTEVSLKEFQDESLELEVLNLRQEIKTIWEDANSIMS